MKIAFISTMSGSPWGGSEALWAATAREAVGAGHEVVFSTLYWAKDVPVVTDLIGRGAVWLPRGAPSAPSRPPVPAGVQSRPRRFAWWKKQDEHETPVVSMPVPRSDFQAVFDARPDVICISQGGTFDFLYLDDLCALVDEATQPFVVLCRFNWDDFSIETARRDRAVRFLQGAAHVGFAARRHRASTERQIAATLPRALVVQSPIGLPDLAALPWPAGDRVMFASVARLDAASKGHDLLFECLSAPAWKERNWRLNIYGEGPDRDRYGQLLRYYALEDRVTLVGHVSDIVGVWRESHVLLLPSRAEGTPQSMIQSMICGRPVVVTDVGGTSDWVTEPETGFVAEAASAPSISRAMDRAWAARETWPAIGQAAHHAALARLDRNPERTLLRLLTEAGGPT